MTGDKKTLLVAEDEDGVRQYLSRLLERSGYKVVPVENGAVAIQEYDKRGENISGILSDIRMPVADGVKLAEHNYKNLVLPIVVCTGVVDAKMALKMLDYGVQDYVVKPFEEQNLLSVLSAALSRPRVKRSLGAAASGPVEPQQTEKTESYKGNVGFITIPSRLDEIQRASVWMEERIEPVLASHERMQFVNFVNEFVFNAHEHGNLEIREHEKASLLESGRYEHEVRDRENRCERSIRIAMSVLQKEIAVAVSDEGAGFDFAKYLMMGEDELISRITLPNGRGIHMGSRFFSSVNYTHGGASVLLTKKIN